MGILLSEFYGLRKRGPLSRLGGGTLRRRHGQRFGGTGVRGWFRDFVGTLFGFGREAVARARLLAGGGQAWRRAGDHHQPRLVAAPFRRKPVRGRNDAFLRRQALYDRRHHARGRWLPGSGCVYAHGSEYGTIHAASRSASRNYSVGTPAAGCIAPAGSSPVGRGWPPAGGAVSEIQFTPGIHRGAARTGCWKCPVDALAAAGRGRVGVVDRMRQRS